MGFWSTAERRLGVFAHRPVLGPAIALVFKRLRSLKWWLEGLPYRLRIRRDPPLRAKISLIVPTYNVAPYLDAFLTTVAYQSTGLHNVEVLIVDDGSTDRSGAIARKWAARFPKAIKYFRKENGGLSSARNFGLDRATGDWVGFPDPDDLLSWRFLRLIDEEIVRPRRRKLLAISLRHLTFHERRGVLRDDHILTTRFKRKRVDLPSSDLGDHILLSVATALFDRESIERHRLRFSERIRPSFEDAHFANRLLVLEPHRRVVFLRSPYYIYRKRASGGSLIDTALQQPTWFIDQIKYGDLDLLKFARDRLGYVPRHVQRAVLYDLSWRFAWLVDHPERSAFVPIERREKSLSLLKSVFDFIEDVTINEFNIGRLHEEHRVGMLKLFKGASRPTPAAYIREIDVARRSVQIAFFYGTEDVDIDVRVDAVSLPRAFVSSRRATFLGHQYFIEHRFWVKMPPRGRLRMTLDGRRVRFKHGPDTLGRELIIEGDLHRILHSPAGSPKLKIKSENYECKYNGCWLFVDREDKADDNAEHLYRYVREVDPTRNVYFALHKKSRDWKRLAKDGFNLLDFGSAEHRVAHENARYLISSHADGFIVDLNGEGAARVGTRKFIFLQHGVIQNDLSRWLNAKRIGLFVTSTAAEYESIASPRSNYVFSQKEVILTGLARHDALISRKKSRSIILIMPTWRQYLTRLSNQVGRRRVAIDSFSNSDYARHWLGLLGNERLKDIADRAGLQIVFCAHANMAMYLPDLALPDHIKATSVLGERSVQDLFCSAAMIVTDYSSVAFDVAFLNRPVAYYQFDTAAITSGEHVLLPGYFDYARDGFGPVCEREEDVLDAVERAVTGKELPHYAERRLSTFPFRDGNNCARIYRAILALEGREDEAGSIGEAGPLVAPTERGAAAAE